MVYIYRTLSKKPLQPSVDIDEQLLLLIANGDQPAMRQFYDRQVELVYSTCLHFLQNVQEAEETTQDVFVEVFQKAASFNAESKVTTWLYRIAANKSLDVIRKRKAKRKLSIVYSIFSKETDQGVSANFHPLELLENKELSLELLAAINQLNDRQKTAFILRFMEHQSQKEIALVMECSEKSVESLIQRAKAQLKKILEHRRNND